MSFLKWIRVLHGQRVVVYRDAQPVEMLRPGRYLRVAVGGGLEIERFSTRDPWVVTHMLPEIVRAGLLEGEAVVLDLVDRERAIVRIDGRYAGVAAYEGSQFAVCDANGARLVACAYLYKRSERPTSTPKDS